MGYNAHKLHAHQSKGKNSKPEYISTEKQREIKAAAISKRSRKATRRRMLEKEIKLAQYNIYNAD